MLSAGSLCPTGDERCGLLSGFHEYIRAILCINFRRYTLGSTTGAEFRPGEAKETPSEVRHWL
ncbi:hypothetical protein N7468_005595 [Penicillium chermesinum]|uniref:Uncharacterized protein n=1 Tax=Penicillium chermesinum TaxID=63820 RepID=A0A9W9NZB8_9EURO|nr:uncharacterized protein N7468_005595 [Penicillium chermesinum]KAJ5232639.1 hypothetical protein N7468_005595 [Penicillium chermesinum]KAJ6172298.1 hypothetical protein N7470_001365 [Penicillium chermesinum]